MMTGYDKWERAAHNRISEVNKINLETVEGLNILKHWLNDHNNGDSTGGLATFSTAMNNFSDTVRLQAPSYDAEELILTDMHYYYSNDSIDPSSHMMTFVGYNDSVMYDFNNDGQFTNHIDTNGDEPFYVTGEFADLVKVPASGGVPSSHNSAVFAQLAEQYPDKDWSDFDLRTNHTSSQVYKTDGSTTNLLEIIILKEINEYANLSHPYTFAILTSQRYTKNCKRVWLPLPWIE